MRSSGLKSSKWAIFGVLACIYFLVYFHRTSPAVMADEFMKEFAVSALAVGILSSAYFYPYAILQIPVGVLSDLKGAKWTVMVFTCIAFFGILILVLAKNYEMAVFSRLLIGIGVAGVYVPTIKIISVWFRQNEFATATGILFAIGNLGAILSAYPLALAVELFGWRLPFAFLAIITLFLIFLCFKVVKDAPRDFKEEKLRKDDLYLIVGNLSLWLIAISAMLRYGIVMGFQGLWGGPYLIDVYGLSKATAGTILMLVGIGTIVGALIFGRISDLIGLKKTILILGGIGFTITWLPLVVYISSLSIASICLISFFIGFFSSTGPVAYAIVKELFPLRMTGLSMSVVNVFPFFGAALFQTIMGYLMDSVGKIGSIYPVEAYNLSFEFCLLASVLSVICVLFVKEKSKEEQ
ncbi:MAG: MFS transporter [Archaeoglobales archaeon]|nr:MFS transporter [Archaeoglobales archaeon]